MMLSELNAQDLFILDNLLRKHKTLPIVGTHGFLTAAASSVQHRDIDELLPFIFGGQLPPILDDQKQTLRNLLNVLYQHIQQELENDIDHFSPLNFLKKAEEVESETREQALQLWCIGYLQGTRLDVDYWRESHGAEVDLYFYPLVLIAGDTQQLALEDSSATSQAIEAALTKARNELLKSIIAIYRITHP